MNILDDQIADYLTNLIPPRPPELQKMEAYAEKHDFPIIGPVCGYLCYQLARSANAKRVFELGSGYGYSTAWFALAVQENGGGEVNHVVWDEKLSQMAREHLKALGYEGIIKYTVGEAVQALKKAEGLFDVIFMDIDKEGYPSALPIIYDKLNVGGLLIIDNMLWSRRVLDKKDQSAATRAIRETSELLTHDERWACSIIPIRDGLMVATKLS